MLELDTLRFDLLLTDLDTELGLRIKLLGAVKADKSVEVYELFVFILRRHFIVLMHNLVAEVSWVFVVWGNATIETGVLQKHHDFFRR
jgi:hypothetical protein